jgi:hypothetical protein
MKILTKPFAFTFIFFLFLSGLSHAAVFTSDQLIFTAQEQSIWGPTGSTSSFGSSGSDLGLSYSIGMSSGSVSGEFQGTLSADYTSHLLKPGTTSLSLNFQGNDDGEINSSLGAWADLSFLGFDFINIGLSLNPNNTINPEWGQETLGSDTAYEDMTLFDVLVLEAGAFVGIAQYNYFTALGVEGQLAYSLRGSNATNYTPIDFSGSTLDIDVLLSQPGIWDFWVEDLSLNNSFGTSFDVVLGAYEEHIDGIEWVRKCVGPSWLRTCWWVPKESYDRNEVTLADINVYDGSPFTLEFNEVTDTNGFSIHVGVPIPTPLLLIGSGVLLVSLYSRRRTRLQ